MRNSLRKNALYEVHGFSRALEFVHLSKDKPLQRDAAEAFPQPRFSGNDKMVHGKHGKSSCRGIFLCPWNSWQCPGKGCASREMAKNYVLTY
jgi:hypothetical protein